jgi:5-methylcytosine-specific restriction endonuclease McrA
MAEFEAHTCSNCGKNVEIRCDGRVLRQFEWCTDCKSEHDRKDWELRWFNHRFQLFTRRDIIVRDGGKCYICRKNVNLLTRDATIDHVVPKSRGGLSSPDNLRLCCNACNNKKGDFLLEEMDL